MGKRIYSLQRIRNWLCYDLDDVCALYKKYGLHPQTVRGWIKKGLPTVAGGRPTLIYGADLREFLAKQNESGKCKTVFHEMFCLKCKDARPAFKRQIVLEQVNGSVRAKAHCQTCKSIMNKPYKLSDIPHLRKVFRVGDVLELYDSAASPLNAHLTAPAVMPVNESAIRDLFQ